MNTLNVSNTELATLFSAELIIASRMKAINEWDSTPFISEQDFEGSFEDYSFI